jgi:signal transduction histidine kinase
MTSDVIAQPGTRTAEFAQQTQSSRQGSGDTKQRSYDLQRGGARIKFPLRVLHLEDDQYDAELVRLILEQAGIACAIARARSGSDFAAAIESGGLDLILADFSVPGFNGLAALAMARNTCPDVPFILVSGTVGEEKAIELLKNGATDYVMKGRLARLVPAVRRAMLEVEQRAEHRRAESKRKLYNRKLQALSRQLVEAQETERRYIARELHDQVGQALTVAQLHLQTMLRSPDGETLKPGLKETLEVVEQVLAQVRDLSLELRPSLLDDLGLEPALQWYTTRQATLAGIKSKVRADPLQSRLDPVIETGCFRVAQEALTNVTRHANASNVTVDLHEEDGCLHLRVRDDGTGFEVSAVRERAVRGLSLGLLNMEERAVLAGGELEYNSAPGQGTEVHAWFPLKWQVSRS